MVVVLCHHAVTQLLPTERKQRREILHRFSNAPNICKLVHHHHAKPVAGVQKGLAARIVGASHCVETCLFQQLHPALLRPVDGRGAQDAIVVVDASPPKLHCFSIDAQPMARIQLKGAHTEGRLILIQKQSSLHGGQTGSLHLVERSMYLIEVGIVQIPAMGILHI